MPSSQFLRNKKQVYVTLKLIDGTEELTSVVVYEDQTSAAIRKMFMLKCDITDARLILKLRNNRGSVVPFTYQVGWNLVLPDSLATSCLQILSATRCP